MSARVSAQPATVIKDLFPPPPPFQIPPPPASDLTSIATGDIDMPCRMSGSAHQGEDPLPPAPELQFQIAVGRYVGPTNPDGTLVHAAQMIQDGTLGPFAELTLVFYESILTNQLGGGCTPPRHRLMYNGQWLADGVPGEPGTIQSFGRGWRSQTFRVPISWVRFPAEPGAEPGIAPTPAVNDIHIAWDPWTPLIQACNTCIAVSSMSQRTRVVSPVILIHGNGLAVGWWSQHGFTSELDASRIIWDGPSFDPSMTSTDANALAMERRDPNNTGNPFRNVIVSILLRLGATRCHFVCHSKGGLDARRWLSTFYPLHDRVNQVISITTLSTPHNGSVLADITTAISVAARRRTRYFQHVGFPIESGVLSLHQLVKRSGYNDGHPSLVPSECAASNVYDLPRIGPSVARFAVGSDMDNNDTVTVDNLDELREMDVDAAGLLAYAMRSGWQFVLAESDTIYQGLRNISTVRVRYERIGFADLAVWTAVGPGASNDTRNDLLVTVSSGVGEGSFNSVGSSAETLVCEGPELTLDQLSRWVPNLTRGQNHSSIGGPGVARTLIERFLLPIDGSHAQGGLR